MYIRAGEVMEGKGGGRLGDRGQDGDRRKDGHGAVPTAGNRGERRGWGG